MMVQQRCRSDPPHFDSVAAVFAVDLDQRIVSSTPAADTILGGRVLGDRPCYEIMRTLDLRNSIQCRPDCFQITAARGGRTSRGAVIWDAMCLQPRPVTTLVERREGTPPVVIHVLWEADDPAGYPKHTSPQTLTRRQAETLRLLARGMAPRGIAGTLGVSPITVRNHIQTAMERLDAHTRLEAVMVAARAGLL